MGIRVLIDDGPTVKPGAIRFTPNGAIDMASFTFFWNTAPFEANDHHYFQVWWRSPFGVTTMLVKATMNLVYQEGTHAC